ncbi:MAG: hypothetical protein RLZZ546_445, partial [Bacteroidota bacterium]
MNFDHILIKYSPVSEYNFKQIEYIAEKLDEKYLLEFIDEIFRLGGFYIGSKIGSISKYDSCYNSAYNHLVIQLENWKKETINFLNNSKNPSNIKNRTEAIKYYRLFESFAFFNFKNFVLEISNFEYDIKLLVRDLDSKKKRNIYFYFKILQNPFKSKRVTEDAFILLLEDFLELTLQKERLNEFERYLKTSLLELFAYSTNKYRLADRTIKLLIDFRAKFIDVNSNFQNQIRYITDDLYLELIINKNCNTYLINNGHIINKEIENFQDRCKNQIIHNNTLKEGIYFLIFLNKLGYKLPNRIAEEYITSFVKNFKLKLDLFIQNNFITEYEKGFFIRENINDILTAYNLTLRIYLNVISHLNSSEIIIGLNKLFNSYLQLIEVEPILFMDSHFKKFISIESFNISTHHKIRSDSKGQIYKIKLPPFNLGYYPSKESSDNDESLIERNLSFALDTKIIERHFTTTKFVLLSKISQSDTYLLKHFKINPLLFNTFYFLMSQVFNRFNITRFFPFNIYTPYSRSLLNSNIVPPKFTSTYILDLDILSLKHLTKKISPQLFFELECYFENNQESIFSELKQLQKQNSQVLCKVFCKIKGGFTVTYKGLFGFLPGSQCNINKVSNFLGSEISLNILETNSVLLSFTASKKDLETEEMLSTIEKGNILEGFVKNITSYGVFIDLGGVDGLIHITDLTWGRITHPEEILKVNQKVNVVILDFDDEKKRIALGYKQLKPHPWDSLDTNLKVGDKVTGKVVVIADYGAFIEITSGVEGLIHVSEM